MAIPWIDCGAILGRKKGEKRAKNIKICAVKGAFCKVNGTGDFSF